MKKSSCLKPQSLLYVASPYGPSIKFIQIMPLEPKMTPPPPNIKLTFSKYRHVEYKIKGNAAYNNILANILLLHLSLTPGVGSNG